MSTDTTKQATVTATSPLALQAVARHLLDHDLTVDSIRAPRTSLGETSVIVQVPADDGDGYWAARWQDTIHVDGQTTVPIIHPEVPQDLAGACERYVVHGRLPDSGVRVSVVTVRRVFGGSPRRQLVAVPDGVA